MSNKVHLYELSEAMSLVLEAGGEISFVTSGFSMLPLLRNKMDKVFLKKNERLPKKGDVIFYRRENGAYVLHRIIGKKNGGYVLRGDNQTDIEYGVSNEQILATLQKVIRADGKEIKCDSVRYRLYVLFLPFVRLFRLKIYPIYVKTIRKFIKN